MYLRTPAVAAFGVAFAAALTIALLHGEKPFYYDAGHYWELGDSFVVDGDFSLLNFDSPLRGYLLALIYHGLAGVADGLTWSPSSVVKIFNAAIVAAISTVLAPSLARLAWPELTWGFWRRLGLAALVLVFWRSYMSFPLSDFPALAAVMLALVAVGRAEAPGWMLVAGASSAAAINMRPAYILVVPAVVGLLAIAWWKARAAPRRSTARGLLGVAALLVGFAAISLPQSLATDRHHDSSSFVPGAVADLSSLQFTAGLTLQRYETFVGSDRPGGRMMYFDPTGQRILQSRDDAVVDDAGEYARIVVSHPIIWRASSRGMS